MTVKRFLLLSGAIGAGKSSIAAELKKEHCFYGISTGNFLREHQENLSLSGERVDLQELGDKFDVDTNFSWIIESVARPVIESSSGIENWFLDAVRKPRQVELFRNHFGSVVKHVHVVAPDTELQRRFLEREQYASHSGYLLAINHPNELAARSLVSIADYTFDTTIFSVADIAKNIFFLWER